jgi:hypothetical protein
MIVVTSIISVKIDLDCELCFSGESIADYYVFFSYCALPLPRLSTFLCIFRQTMLMIMLAASATMSQRRRMLL